MSWWSPARGTAPGSPTAPTPRRAPRSCPATNWWPRPASGGATAGRTRGSPARCGRARPWAGCSTRSLTRPSPPRAPPGGGTRSARAGAPGHFPPPRGVDALTSQANVAGYKAALTAATAFGRFFPLLITAAGTARPAKVLVLGTGVAGLQAIGTAKRLGAVVSAYDVRPQTKTEVESLG